MTQALAEAAPQNSLALALIRFYRKWISPHKGFRCAHHAVHGQGTCSGYGLEVFSMHAFPEAWSRLMHRFRECGQAYKHVSASREEEERRRRGGGDLGSSLLATDISLEGCGDLLSCGGDGLDACASTHSCHGLEACDAGACDGLGSCSFH